MHGWQYDPFLDFFELIGRDEVTTSDRATAAELTPQKTEWRLSELRHTLAVSSVVDIRLIEAIKTEKQWLTYFEKDGSLASID